MALKDDYSKQIVLRCMTCGATYAFETCEKNGSITCKKCNRVYHGGKEELVRLNEALIADEQELLVEEVTKDIGKEIQKMFKNLKL
jgi:RNase P subunit RPR2